LIYLLEVLAWNGSSVETLRASTHTKTTSPTDTPANTTYHGDILDPGKFTQEMFAGGMMSGNSGSSHGYIELKNTGRIDSWINYGFGRQFTLKWLTDRHAPVSGAQVLATGIVAGINTSGRATRLTLRIADKALDLDRPLLTARYAGTTLSAGPTAEGDASMAGKLKQCVWGGTNTNVPGVMVNQHNLLFQFAANGCNGMTCYDGGLELPSVGDFPVLSSLIAASVPGGRVATCFGQGIARYGVMPEKDPAADVTEGSSASARTAANLMDRILAFSGQASSERSGGSLNALQSFTTAALGIVVNDETTVASAVAQIANSVGAALVNNSTGILEFPYLAAPSTTSVEAAFGLREIGDDFSITPFVGAVGDSQGVPAYSVELNFGRVWHVQQESSLWYNVSAARKALLRDQWRKAVSTDNSVLTPYPRAGVLRFDTLLVNESEAVAEAVRRLALYKVRRDLMSFSASDEVASIALGRTVRVQMQRFGYSAGRNMVVIGREFDRRRNRVRLTLWG